MRNNSNSRDSKYDCPSNQHHLTSLEGWWFGCHESNRKDKWCIPIQYNYEEVYSIRRRTMKSKKKEKKEKSESNNDRIELERIDSCTNDDKRTLHEHRFWQKFFVSLWYTTRMTETISVELIETKSRILEKTNIIKTNTWKWQNW